MQVLGTPPSSPSPFPILSSFCLPSDRTRKLHTNHQKAASATMREHACGKEQGILQSHHQRQQQRQQQRALLPGIQAPQQMKRPLQPQHGSSSDEEDASSLSASSNCSSGPGGSEDESRMSSSRTERQEGAAGTHSSGVWTPAFATNAVATAAQAARAEERHNKRVTRIYMKAVRLLTKMCMVLEDDRVIVCRPNAPPARKLGKFMVRYDRLLGRLEALAAREGPLASASVPGGLLKALDDDADPCEWIEACVLAPHRKENDRARGLLHALGSYQASILHVLRWGFLEAPLPPLHQLRPQPQQQQTDLPGLLLLRQQQQEQQQYFAAGPPPHLPQS
ncbi:hypothetical protein Esti_006599 [Eimeria stiedai]